MSVIDCILTVKTETHAISQTICFTVHVARPRVQRQKQIPVNARTNMGW